MACCSSTPSGQNYPDGSVCQDGCAVAPNTNRLVQPCQASREFNSCFPARLELIHGERHLEVMVY